MLSEVTISQRPAAPMELDPKHPGIHDPEYVARRQYLYNLAYEYRVGEKGWPEVEYSPREDALWRHISERLVEVHERRACKMYLRGKELLNIETRFMPQLGGLDRRMRQEHGFGLVPAEGLIDVELFFSYLRGRQMPATQFLRHWSVPQFTPEPDAVHDVTGHVPCLMDKDYTDVVQEIGEGLLAAPREKRSMWSRIYWFSIEFGLIEEAGEVKVFGAGLLSSVEEMDYCYGDKVDRRPFVLEDVISTPYDPSRMQDTVFVLPSLEHLRDCVRRLRRITG